MARRHARFSILLITIIGCLASLYLLTNNRAVKRIHVQIVCNSSIDDTPKPSISNEHLNNIYGWRLIGDTAEEQRRLHDISNTVKACRDHFEDNIPTVPCLSEDKHLLILSASASRVRYGTSITFMMVFPSDVTKVLPKNSQAVPISPTKLKLWCIFDDGSVTSAYSYDSNYGNDRVSLVDCPLSPFASDELWRYSRILRVYLVSTTDKDQNIPIAKALVTVPLSALPQSNINQRLMTLCTSPLHNKAHHVIEWVEFHRLVGFQKFVIYNTTDTNGQLEVVLSNYTQKYPNLIDVVQWNFSALAPNNVLGDRYFQVEALHDCLIRYGDQSEWLGTIDLDEYVVPIAPYNTVLDYLTQNFGQRPIGSVILWSQFFCTEKIDKYNEIESNSTGLVIERFTFRAPTRYKIGREKYLYRPRFVQYLSIHHQLVGMSKQEPSENHIMLAHYVVMDYLRTMPGCDSNRLIKDNSIRNRFASRVNNAVTQLLT